MAEKPTEQPPKAGATFALLAALVGLGTASALLSDTKADEGVVYRAYPDLGGVWSICSGSTHGVKAGEVDTGDQCDARTSADLLNAAKIVLRVSPGMKAPERHNQLRALIRFQNNTGKYPVSSARIAFNAGRLREGCDRLLAYNGIISLDRPIRGAIQVREIQSRNGRRRFFNVIRGLNNRRHNEHVVCIRGLP